MNLNKPWRTFSLCTLSGCLALSGISIAEEAGKPDSELIAEGHGGHHGGHHGRHHGHHGNHHHDHHHHHNHWHHDHGNRWWHHDHHPDWEHNHWHHWHGWHNTMHDWYWYGGGNWGANPGYYYDPNFYYDIDGMPSVEYEYDEPVPAKQTNSQTEITPKSSEYYDDAEYENSSPESGPAQSSY